MKKNLLTILFLLIAGWSFSQTTYYWVGGAGPVDFITNSNWNTALDGSGITRATENASDILVFNGTNIGGTVPATGTVTANVTGTSCGQILLMNGASVNLRRITTGSGTITIIGGTGDDLVVPAGCTLNITSTDAGGSAIVLISSAATGTISGSVNISGGGSRLACQNPAAGGALFFENAAVCTVNIPLASSYPFGGNNTQTAEKSIVFKTGSTLIRQGGNSVFGNTSTFNPILFQPGSTMVFEASEVAGIFGSRSFADVIIRPLSTSPSTPVTVTVNGSIFNIDNLTIQPNATFNLQVTGVAPISGNIVNNGTFGANTGFSSSNLAMIGLTPQLITGTGVFNPLGAFTVGTRSDVTLDRPITIAGSATSSIVGRLNVKDNTIGGTSNFQLRGAQVATFTANTTAGSNSVTTVSNFTGIAVGTLVTGAGIQPNTFVIGTNSGGLSFTISKPATATGTTVSLTVEGNPPTLATSNAGGIDASITTTGTRTFSTGSRFEFNAPTLTPLSTTASVANTVGMLTANANISMNRNVTITDTLIVNAVIKIPAGTELRLAFGNIIRGGPFGISRYIATAADAATGSQGVLRVDNVFTSTMYPIGSLTNYLPVTVNASSNSDFSLAVFEGATLQGTPNGTAMTAQQKQTMVDAVWNINRLTGSGAADLILSWPTSLEGSAFTTFAGADIGIITNLNPGWSTVTGTGDNIANTATSNFSSFGAFGVAARPPAQSFLFNPLPGKIYGNPDFDAGVISSNTTMPITYTSSNTAVATIVGNLIHIVGTGTTDITAAQATDGFYPAASVTQTLTVAKADLTIRADDKAKPEGDPNPTLTATYTGFVYGENQSVLLTPVVLSTTATTASLPGTYPITVSGATAANYNINFVNGVLTVSPKQTQTITFNTLPAKTYGNANFAAGATSTNNTIPITYTSSNTAVATIVGSNIHIVGPGTSTITASQAGNSLYFAAANVSRTLTVNKAALTIRVRDTLRTEGEANPPFTITYTGFVLGETAANLLTPVTATTTATPLSAPGYYPITLSGATSNNYNITYANGRLTVLPLTGSGLQHLNVYMSNSSTLTVRVYSPQPALGDITVYDLGGRPLMKKNLFMPTGFISTDLQVPTVPPGIYIVTVTGDGVNLKKTIAIMR